MKNYLKLLFLLPLFSLFSIHAAEETYDKWIVITTIQYPTKAVKQMASMPGWHLVVIGDKKTPKDWYLDNCEYLSVEKQQELDYEIAKLLPWNHYCRKNIGYLYAIQHGAKLIYETDDDNELIEGVPEIPNNTDVVELSSQSNSVNIYAYFGFPNVWPRGYPLHRISTSKDYVVQSLSSQREIGIVQGLVNKDPDVDAIYRLTQGAEIYFEARDPCVLGEGIFCPFNTQNTIYRPKAFWGLFIPTTTPFRVCDIWRSYFVERLLWDLNLSVCFTSPSAIQERNLHNYFKDFCDEQELYRDAGKLIDFLHAWKDSSNSCEERYLNLTNALIEKGYLKQLELDILRAWMQDLRKVGYEFPN